jgi:hypothetical protein
MPEIGEVIKTADKKPEVSTPVVPEKVVTATTIDKKPPVKKAPVKKEVKDPADKTTQYVRPAMEMLTRDFEQFLVTLTINKKPLEHLEFKCGKIIYGLKSDKGKDLRIIGIKARGKHKSVEGKSRCIYYFGVTKDMSKQLKDFPGVRVSKFALGSVQSKHAIELVLDKVTYTEIFKQNIDKVTDTLKKLATITVEQREEQLNKLKKEAEAE